MFIKCVNIKNFRSFLDSGDIPFNQFTTFLGNNGSGKSNIFKAIKYFYDTNISVSSEDFYNRNTESPISIALTFKDLNGDELEHFGSFVQGGILLVEKVFSLSEGNIKGLYYGQMKQNPDFAALKNLKATEKRTRYNELRSSQSDKYNDLPNARSAADVDAAIKEWETNNPEKLQWVKSEVQFIGARNIGGGSLDNYTRFILVPAVREASLDASEARGSALGELMNILVKEVVFQKKEIVELQKNTAEEFKRLTNLENLPELPNLEKRLTDRLGVFVPDSAVHLGLGEFEEPSFDFPRAIVELTEDRFRGNIEGKGHGLQRSFIISIIQELAVVQAQRDEQERRNHMENEDLDLNEGNTGIAEDFKPDLILAIEEPELFQHPIRQKHFFDIISNYTLPDGTRSRIQTLICTHSPYFISMKKFNDIRFVIKKVSDEGNLVSLLNIGDSKLATENYCSARDIRHPNVDVFINGLKSISDINVNEAFFANYVIIVEGVVDKVVIEAFLKRSGIDCIKHGIPIIDAEGKANVSKVYAILKSFNIDSFVIFDCDGNQTENDKKVKHELENKTIFKLLSYDFENAFPAEPIVESAFACFPINLEMTMQSELTDYDFFSRRSAIASQLILNKKNPIVYETIIEELNERNLVCQTLESIVDKIKLKFRLA